METKNTHTTEIEQVNKGIEYTLLMQFDYDFTQIVAKSNNLETLKLRTLAAFRYYSGLREFEGYLPKIIDFLNEGLIFDENVKTHVHKLEFKGTKMALLFVKQIGTVHYTTTVV